MLHDILDFFSLLIAILALLALFVDPTGTRRQVFLKIALAIATSVLLLYRAYTYWQRRKEEARQRLEQEQYDNQVKDKEKLVITTLCNEPGINYEQLYNETSQGFADTVLNEAIDELTQKKGLLRTSWINVPMSGSRSLTVRLYYVNQNACGR